MKQEDGRPKFRQVFYTYTYVPTLCMLTMTPYVYYIHVLYHTTCTDCQTQEARFQFKLFLPPLTWEPFIDGWCSPTSLYLHVSMVGPPPHPSLSLSPPSSLFPPLTWKPLINEGVQLINNIAHGREVVTVRPHLDVHTLWARCQLVHTLTNILS